MIRHITLHPSRIGCPSIPGTLKGVIHSIVGVADVIVRYADRSLDITFDDETTSAQDIVQKIGEEMGIAMEIADAAGSVKEGNPADTCPM